MPGGIVPQANTLLERFTVPGPLMKGRLHGYFDGDIIFAGLISGPLFRNAAFRISLVLCLG
jgi:hypothetical protein